MTDVTHAFPLLKKKKNNRGSSSFDSVTIGREPNVIDRHRRVLRGSLVQHNLLLVSTRFNINRDHRVAVARAWALAAVRGETQAGFCARQVPAISPRTLRQWVKKFAPAEPPLQQAHAIVQRAIADLQAVLDRLAADRPAPARPLISPAPVRCGVPGGATATSSDQRGSPGPTRSFDWDS